MVDTLAPNSFTTCMMREWSCRTCSKMSVARLFFFLLFSDVAVSGTAVMNASSAIALVLLLHYYYCYQSGPTVRSNCGGRFL